MQRILFSILVLILVSGCAKKDEPAAMKLAERAATPAGKARSFLAYEHSISIDVEEQKIAAVFEMGQAACHEASSESCSILESRLNTGRESIAFLKFRAKPAGIKRIITSLAKQAEISEQSTTAEDLEAPISDTTKKLAMLKDYRSKLDALHGRANNDVDSLIKVSRELAQVQSELESIEGSHAHLMQRVETEVLMVSIRSIQSRAFWKPIGNAISDFGGNFSQGISSAITGIAFLIPWAVVLLLGGWGSRASWRRWKRAKTNN